MLPIKGPAHLSLSLTEPTWALVSGERADMIQAWARVAGKVMSWEGKDDGMQGYYRIIPSEGAPLFIKVLPDESIDFQRQSDRIARWLSGKGIAVSCMISGYPKKLTNSMTMFAYKNIDGHYCSGKEQELERLGRSLARLHQTLEQCPWKHEIKKNGMERHSLLQQTLLDIQCNPDVFKRTPVSVRRLLANEVERGIMEVLLEDPQVIHGDLNFGNVMFGNDVDDVIFLDFEDTNTAWFSPQMELGFALERFALKEDDALSQRLSRALIKTYRMEGGCVFQYRAQLAEILQALSVRALLLLVLVAEKQAWDVPDCEWDKFIFLYRQAMNRTELLGNIVSG